MATTQFEAFKKTLKKVFMLDQAELDFGIYRIMNQKRNDIEKYLNENLKAQVVEILEKNKSSQVTDLENELKETVKAAEKFGMLPDDMPKVKELKAKIAASGNTEELENEVYSHLTTFFSRYYDGGDFISQRRYKKDVYAIPYEGEEVKLYWANADQYYIKTSEYFRNYRFKLDCGKYVEFTLKEASTEQNNNKAQNNMERCFALYEECPVEVLNDELHINFTYELYPKATKQKTLIESAFNAVKDLLPSEFKMELLALRPTDSDRGRTLLQKHLNDYVGKNKFDYFIHKDLKGFLSRELDFYIKNEILEIDDIDARTTESFFAHLTVIKAIKNVGSKIIEFLASLENFQKRLWLKKKMVVSADYCITLDRVPEKLYAEICANDAQREEWVKLFAIDEIKPLRHDGFFKEGGVTGYSVPLTEQFLKENPFLVLDTAFFTDDFKHKLISEIDDLDKKCDGLLINSENFQALKLLQYRYKGEVKCIYIDPPYNTGGDDFVYKDNYQESSWLTLMSDRFDCAKPIFKDGGTIAVSIDIKELDKLICLLDAKLGSYNRKANITVRRASISGAKVINPGVVNISENVIIYSNGKGIWIPYDAYREKKYDNDSRYKSIIVNINDNPDKWVITSVLNEFAKYKDIPKSKLRSILGDKYEDELYDFVIKNASSIIRFAALDENSIGKEVTELKRVSIKNPNKVYILKREGNLNDYYIINGQAILFYKDRLKRIGERMIPVEKVSDIWDDVLPNDIHNEGGVVLKKGKKPEKLIDRILEATTKQNDLILDFFAGSGTSGAVALKSKRKFINIELGDYFYSKTLKRIKYTLHGDKSGVTEKYNWKGGGVVKYLKIEQYEDTLNNLVVRKNSFMDNQSGEFFDGYMLGYLLDTETKDSLFSLEWFINPWNTKLKITRNNETKEEKVDLVETFNYLIGLNVQKITYPKSDICVVEGYNRKNEHILIIWRDCIKVSNKALNEFFKKMAYSTRDREFDRIYVNGDNNLENLKTDADTWKVTLIEQEFSKKMFEEE